MQSAANVWFPPFVSNVSHGPQQPFVMGRPAAAQLPLSGRWRGSTFNYHGAERSWHQIEIHSPPAYSNGKPASLSPSAM